jgi:hypothetical protein
MISVGQPGSRLWRRMVLPTAGVLAPCISGERLLRRRQQHSGCLRKHTGQGRNRGYGRAPVLAPLAQWLSRTRISP